MIHPPQHVPKGWEMKTANLLAPAQAAYLAGIIDGEGYIGFDKNKQGKSTRYNLRLAVKTTSQALAHYLADITGLGASIQDRNDKRGDRQKCYEWRIFGHQALGVLRQIRGYLVVKEE